MTTRERDSSRRIEVKKNPEVVKGCGKAY